MRRILAVILVSLFLMGCGATARQSEFWQHDSMYKDWGHLWFSWYGHKNPNQKMAQSSQEKGWWGIEVPYVPAQ